MTDARPAPEERTLPRLLQRRVDRDPAGVFLLDEIGALTTAEVWTQAGRFAAGLRRRGVGAGDRVALMMRNSRDFVIAWFGVSMAGAIQVPVNPEALGSYLAFVLGHSGARALVVDAELSPQLATVREQIDSLDLVVVHGGDGGATSFEALLHDQPWFDGARQVEPWDTTAIMYTSGSTGRPKGVVLPHGQHVENGWQAAHVAAITELDRLFVCLPLHHNMAQGYGIMPALVSGASVHLTRRFDRTTFWSDVRAGESTVWPFVGAMLVLLAKDIDTPAPNPLRVAYGVPIPAQIHQRFESAFDLRLIPCYGSTEATIVAWGSLAGGEPVGSCGTAYDTDFEVEIQAPDGAPVSPGEVGEICVRPREPWIMFQGYHDDAERDRLAHRNLWFHSGDRGRVDADGWFWFEGRNEDVVRRFGEFIATSHVEEALLASPQVDMVAAYGIVDEVAGEEVMVAVVLRPGADLDRAAIRAWCAKHLPAYCVPRYIEIVDALPMTSTGKVEKYVLRQRGVTSTTDDVRSPRSAS